jgi:hypothetical protein
VCPKNIKLIKSSLDFFSAFHTCLLCGPSELLCWQQGPGASHAYFWGVKPLWGSGRAVVELDGTRERRCVGTLTAAFVAVCALSAQGDRMEESALWRECRRNVEKKRWKGRNLELRERKE